MLKYIALTIIIVGLLIAAYLVLLGHVSRSHPPRPAETGNLAPCPETENCVCSEYPEDRVHYIKPIDLSATPQITDLDQLVPIITDMGGEIVVLEQDYLSAIFKSRVFGFTDDFELRLDQADRLLHLRSASRVGRSDLGANKSRVDAFRKEYYARF